MVSKLDSHLNSLVRSDIIREWRTTMGYGNCEYTIELRPIPHAQLKNLCKTFVPFGATNFTKFKDDQILVVKFVVGLG